MTKSLDPATMVSDCLCCRNVWEAIFPTPPAQQVVYHARAATAPKVEWTNRMKPWSIPFHGPDIKTPRFTFHFDKINRQPVLHQFVVSSMMPSIRLAWLLISCRKGKETLRTMVGSTALTNRYFAALQTRVSTLSEAKLSANSLCDVNLQLDSQV